MKFSTLKGKGEGLLGNECLPTVDTHGMTLTNVALGFNRLESHLTITVFIPFYWEEEGKVDADMNWNWICGTTLPVKRVGTSFPQMHLCDGLLLTLLRLSNR